MADRPRLRINMQTIKTGARILVPVGAGALAAKVGGSVARRVIPGADAFAAESPEKGALVDAGAGLALDAVGLMILAKATTPAKAAAFAPYVVAGTLLAAGAPVVADKLIDGVMSVVDSLLPGTSTPPGGVYIEEGARWGGEMPGGIYIEPGARLGGELMTPGGLTSQRFGAFGPYIGGELLG